ncbi:MAG: helix-turn-helix domain-containing protein [Ruminococcaceae bacterium]|nr:helix-turn-helix domain-containing protein [Oscillospiraceae bacterium]
MYEVLKYIHENIKENMTLSEISEKFGYSKWYFCTKFREYTGRSFVKYIRYFRLHLAAADLLCGCKVSDVAFEYGYESVGGFNKAFLAEFGCYPSEYKKNTKEALIYYERKRHTMFQLSDRCEALKKCAMTRNDFEDFYCVQRIVYTSIGQSEAAKESLTNDEILAGGIARTLDSFTPVIQPDELIVGFNYANSKYPERLIPKNDEKGLEIMRMNRISEADIETFFSVRYPSLARVPIRQTEAEINSKKEWAAMGRCQDNNHSVIAYEKVLRLGFKGLYAEIEAFEKKNGKNKLYNATKRICLSAMKMGKKYAAEARRLKEIKDERYSEADLDRIISVCERVPENSATTFHEAVQALWFAHIINTWEDNINANSLGRLDQILYPYYKSDVESGKVSKEEIFELICCLWIKLYLGYDVQQSCVGGTSPDGKCQVNELSYMMLDATEQLDFIRCLSVRYSQNSDKNFVKRALEVVGHVQKGVPFFFNDDVMIPALESKGISHEDACDYTQIGCVETVIPGKSNPHAVTGETNLLKALEYVFCNGYSMMYPEMKNGYATGELSDFDTFEKFYDAVLRQIYEILDLTCETVKRHREFSVNNSPRPYKSLLTEGCLESGRDFNDAGAVYDYYQIMLGGVPNLADSLEVIRKFVYVDRKYTLEEIKNILENDFPDESVRQEFINKAAKFGNDIDSVDSLAVDIVDRSCDYLDELSDKYCLSFHAQPFTFLWMIDHGRESAASPDGRRKGEIIAYSCSPMQGRDFNGLTALLNSIAKFPTKRTPGTTSAIVEIDPKLFTDRNISLLTDLLLAASIKGLSNVQFNTIDADTLIDAKKHPEKYNNLAVRVSGFSQKFNAISPEIQDHIIARTKHSCL